MTAHLNDKGSALVDGQLNGISRDRSLAHLAWCDRCRKEVEVARLSRQFLACDLVDVRPAPDFMARLLALGIPDVPVALDAPVTGLRADQTLLLVAHETLPPRWQALCGDVPEPPRRWVKGATAVIAGLAITGLGLAVLGDCPVITPDLRAEAALSVLSSTVRRESPHALVVSSNAVTGSSTDEFEHNILEWMREEGWSRPDSLPAGFTVTAVRFTGVGSDILEVDLTTPLGDVVIREQKGQLDEALVANLENVGPVGAPVYLVSDRPAHLLWQSSDTVIDLVGRGTVEDVLQLVSTFSVDTFDTGIRARVGRGWTILTGVLS